MAATKIGVYICHCGTNISGKVDVHEVVHFASSLPAVAIAREYKFMCSDPGQGLIQQDIANLGLDRVVVASCSPLMHEPTFRSTCEAAGLNRYLFEMANIREHCSWVTIDPQAATHKAKALVSAAVAKASLLEPLERKTVGVTQAALIVGGGIAGIQAAIDIADSGRQVYLVERDPSVGGHMAKFDKTFPTLDCAACILTPKMVQVGKHPKIKLMSSSEVEEVTGFVGNFKVKVRRRATYVDESKCNGCGLCWESCPARQIPYTRVMRKGKLIIGKASGARPGAAVATATGGNGAAASGGSGAAASGGNGAAASRSGPLLS